MTAFAALSVAAWACLRLRGRGALSRVVALVAAYATDALSSSSSAWLSLMASALSCARCTTRPVACQLLTSP